MRTSAATRPQQLFWLLLSSQCHLSVAPREMTALLALEPALYCSNVTYRQPGDIYGNASLCRCSRLCESMLNYFSTWESLFGGLEWTTGILEWTTGLLDYWNGLLDYWNGLLERNINVHAQGLNISIMAKPTIQNTKKCSMTCEIMEYMSIQNTKSVV